MDKSVKYTFQKKERDIVVPCCLVLIEIIVAVFGGCFQRDSNFIYDNGIINDLSNWMISFTAITAAIFILCYSVLDAKRLGVSNRTVIRYSLGNKTLSLEFMLVMAKMPILKLFECFSFDNILVVECVWILIQELSIILFIIIASSMAFHIYVIRYQEDWQYKKGKAVNLSQMNTYWNTSHIKQIMESDGIFSDKTNVIYQILEAPFRRYVIKCRASSGTGENDSKIYRSLPFSDKKYIYEFYYRKTREVFSNVTDETEIHCLYDMYYEYIGSLIEEIKRGSVSCQYMAELIIASILNAVLLTEVLEAEEFCRYVLQYLLTEVDKKEKSRQYAYYILTLELSYRLNKQIRIELFADIYGFIDKKQWELLAMDCLEYWYIIINQYTLTDKNQFKKWFYDAIYTAEGKGRKSAIMLYLEKMQEGKNV